MTKQEEHIAVTPKQEDSSLAIVSMVLGIISLTGPGLLLGIPAIVTGSISLKKKLANRGLAITGLVTGIVSTVFSLLFCIFMVFLITWGIAHPEEFENTPRQQSGSPTQEEQPFSQSQT
jgi:O-antigen/teichoic acid export membrane protein